MIQQTVGTQGEDITTSVHDLADDEEVERHPMIRTRDLQALKVLLVILATLIIMVIKRISPDLGAVEVRKLT